MLVAHVTCMLYVKVITYNDIHLPIDPMYLNLPSMLCACCHAHYMLVTCMLDACNMHVTCLLNVPKPLMLHETCMLHECRKRLQHSFNMHVALRM